MSWPRALVQRRNAVALWNLLRTHPQVWQRAFWQNVALARAAQQHGAMQKLRELAPLLALVRRLRPRVVVEIGTARGGTLYAWCRVAHPEATIVSIDLPGGRYGGGYADEDERVFERYAGDRQEIHFIRADSHEASTRARLEEILRGRPIELLMIDGDHTYEGVKQDFEMYAPLVAAGCPVVFHDILPHPIEQECEVDRFWREVKEAYRHTEYVDSQPDREGRQWGGIGVLFVP